MGAEDLDSLEALELIVGGSARTGGRLKEKKISLKYLRGVGEG